MLLQNSIGEVGDIFVVPLFNQADVTVNDGVIRGIEEQHFGNGGV